MDSSRPRVAVIDLVGLSRRILPGMPRLSAWAATKKTSSFRPSFPAVTCTAQSTYLTGLSPEQHGITGNGWYHRTMCEVQFWKQSDKLVQGEKIWETLRRKFGENFTCAKLFWWYNMYSDVNWSMTPRPMYPADGRKVFDIYTTPMNLREDVQKDLGRFPFPFFWGPAAGLPSSKWISEAAIWTENRYKPDLSLVYLPHLDYDLQRFGPDTPEARPAIREADNLAADLIEFYETRGVIPIVLSEYGLSPVRRDIALNRLFRKKGWITVRNEMNRDMLDCGASHVFAIADHQTAHIYINDKSLKEEVIRLLKETSGIADIRQVNPDALPQVTAERHADLVAVAEADAWFSYYYWDDDIHAPDFARCVDIHRKPGYDPAELFLDPSLHCPKLNIGSFLLKKKLGFRALLEVIPLNGNLVRGSHGSDLVDEPDRPLCIAPPGTPDVVRPEDIHTVILSAFS